MKLVVILSPFAALGVIVAATGLAFNALAFAFFATTASTLILLIATCDYARRPNYGTALATVARREPMPLAA